MQDRQTQSPRHILHLTTYLQGGAGRVIADLACGQRAAGHRVTVVTSAHDEPGYCNYPEWLTALRAGDVAVLQVDSLFKRDTARYIGAFASIREALDLSGVSVVHAHAAIPALVGLLLASRARRRVPVVQTVHGWGIAKTPAQQATDVGIMSSLDCVVPVSFAVGRLLERLGVPRDRLEVIHCGVGPAPAPASFDDPAAATMNGWRAAGLTVLICVGSVGARKNQRLLVEALAARGASAGIACAFIGEGDDILPLSALANEAGLGARVRFFGPSPDAAKLIAAADWLVLPSRDEGLPLAVLEAYRAGVPVLCSDIEPLREVVQSGRTGFLFESASIESLVVALAEVAGLNAVARMRMGTTGRRLWEQEFRLSTMTARYGALYAEVIGQERCAGRSTLHC